MKTPAIDTKIINTIPVIISATIASIAIDYFGWEKQFAAVILGIIAGGLVDLDNGLTGKLKNILYAVCSFTVCRCPCKSRLRTPFHWRWCLWRWRSSSPCLARLAHVFAPYHLAHWRWRFTPRSHTTHTRRFT